MNIFKAKKKVGMSQKPRERSVIDVDYQREAIQVGHKIRLIFELRAQLETLETEVEEHAALMRKLNKEFQTAATPQPKPTGDTHVKASGENAQGA